ncbi:MAG: dienelactone hydrolase family protein [Pseudomonadota bacterium]
MNGEDGEFAAYVAEPSGAPKGAIVVIQEIFGVNAVMRGVCDWLASEGFVAASPDLFWRIEPGIELTDQSQAEWDRAFELYNAFNVDKGVEDIQATINFIRDSNPKVGAVGYCLGGLLAYLTSTRTDVDASVGYYGVGIDAHVGEAGDRKNPLMLHIAEEDGFVSKDAQAKIAETLTGDGVSLHSYPGRDHAFAREGGDHYDAEDAKLANGRTVEFFASQLKGG